MKFCTASNADMLSCKKHSKFNYESVKLQIGGDKSFTSDKGIISNLKIMNLGCFKRKHSCEYIVIPRLNHPDFSYTHDSSYTTSGSNIYIPEH